MDSVNLSAHPYSLLPALKEGFFADITFIASNGQKVFILSITCYTAGYKEVRNEIPLITSIAIDFHQ